MANDPKPAPKGNESITMTAEQLRTILSEARAPEPPHNATMEEAFELHQQQMREARERAHVAWYVAFLSRDTNARGVAYVTASRRHAGGRVINLPHYEYPPGSDRTRINGGICDMTEIVGQNGQLLPEYKQWRYTEFWKRDLIAIVPNDASRLDAKGPNRPTLEDALADLEEFKALEALELAEQAKRPAEQQKSIPVPKIEPRQHPNASKSEVTSP